MILSPSLWDRVARYGACGLALIVWGAAGAEAQQASGAASSTDIVEKSAIMQQEDAATEASEILPPGAGAPLPAPKPQHAPALPSLPPSGWAEEPSFSGGECEDGCVAGNCEVGCGDIVGGCGCDLECYGDSAYGCGESCDCGSDCACGAGVDFTSCGDVCYGAPPCRIYADYLLWQPRSTEVAYAVPLFDGAPIGETAVVDLGFQSGIRAGFDMPLTPCSWVGASYTYFSGEANSSTSIDPADGEIFSLVTHPITFDSAIIGYDADARLAVDLQLVDVDYRRMLFRPKSSCCPGSDCGPVRINYVFGLRYANFEQDFSSSQTLTGGAIDPLDRQLNASVDFEGLGPRLGIEAEAHSCYCPLFTYFRTYASFLAGSYEAVYEQVDQGSLVEVFNTWEKDRLAPVWDLEVGFGVDCKPNGCQTRVTVGYVASYWLNTITVDDYITAAQFLDYVDLGDTVSFDGLTVRAEMTY